MVTTVRQQRPKAFIGTAISVGTQLIGGIIGGAKNVRLRKLLNLKQNVDKRWIMLNSKLVFLLSKLHK